MPARVDCETEKRIQETAKIIYRVLGCSGYARVDMFYTSSGEIIFNEVNTIPGFTTHSRYPNMMKGIGLSFTEVLDKLISLYLNWVKMNCRIEDFYKEVIMNIRRRIIDYSRGNNLHHFWCLYRLQNKAGKEGMAHDILTFLLSRCAHRHGGYIGPDTVIKNHLSLPHGLHGVFISRQSSTSFNRFPRIFYELDIFIH